MLINSSLVNPLGFWIRRAALEPLLVLEDFDSSKLRTRYIANDWERVCKWWEGLIKVIVPEPQIVWIETWRLARLLCRGIWCSASRPNECMAFSFKGAYVFIQVYDGYFCSCNCHDEHGDMWGRCTGGTAMTDSEMDTEPKNIRTWIYSSLRFWWITENVRTLIIPPCGSYGSHPCSCARASCQHKPWFPCGKVGGSWRETLSVDNLQITKHLLAALSIKGTFL